MSNDYGVNDGDWANEQDFRTPVTPPAAPAKSPWEGRTATNPKTGQKMVIQGGQWVLVPPTNTGPPPPSNAAQAKLRVMTADQPVAGDEMNQLMTTPDPDRGGAPTRPNLLANTVEGIPFLGQNLHGVANMIRSDKEQTLDSAGQQWITSAAHALSGARIGQEQLHQLLVAYLPAATDKPGNLAFKAAQRQRLQQGIAEASGLTGGVLTPQAAEALVKMLNTAPQDEQGRAAISPLLHPQTQEAPQAQQQSAGRPLSPEEAQRLPPGTPFVGLDGVHRVRH